MFKNFLNSRGFTLVEILASIVLLAVVISISLSIFPNMFKTNDVNEESLDAVAIAKDVLVRIKDNSDQSFVSHSLIVDSPADPAVPTNHKYYRDSTKYPGYEILLIIDPNEIKTDPSNPTSAGLDLYQVTVHVYEGTSIRATNYGYVTGDDF